MIRDHVLSVVSAEPRTATESIHRNIFRSKKISSRDRSSLRLTRESSKIARDIDPYNTLEAIPLTDQPLEVPLTGLPQTERICNLTTVRG